MATEVSKWRCSLCYTEYLDKFSAEDCEMSHLIPFSVNKTIGSKFIYQGNISYPEYVDVGLRSGGLVHYCSYKMYRFPHKSDFVTDVSL